MTNYSCERCLKEFKQKGHLKDHLNKKNTCQPFKPKLIVEEIKSTQQNPIQPEKIEKLGKHECSYCKFEFSTNSHLNRHIKQNRCKVRFEIEKEKEKMFKLLLEQKEEEIKEKNQEHEKEIKEKDEQLKKLEFMIKEQNDKITELIKKIKPSSITNNNTLNNIVIKPVINKFGNENLEKLLNKKNFEDKVLLLTGSNAFEACAKMIYNNPAHPENQTVFCTDLSREKFMVFTGEDWELNTRNEVFTEVQNKIQEYIDMHEEELEDKLKNADFKEKFYNRIGKFYTKYYGNKHEKDPAFENKTDEQLMRFFYKIKELVKNNYNVLYNKALESESKKMIENKSTEDNKTILKIQDKFENKAETETVRKRGRPKKIFN